MMVATNPAQHAPSQEQDDFGAAVQFSLMQRLRHLVKRVPFANEMYDFVTTVLAPDYAEDAIRASKNCGFLRDQDFKFAYDALLRQEPGRKTRWRTHVSLWAAKQASLLEGDFVETGVNRAGAAAAIIQYLDFRNLTEKTFYLFDTYSGLVADAVGQSEEAAFKNRYVDCYEFVKASFSSCPNVRVVQGVVPASLLKVPIEKVAFLSVDMNCARSERSALDYFWPKLVSGGIVLLDDYAFSGRDAQRQSANEFAAAVQRTILTIPTGQGLLIK